MGNGFGGISGLLIYKLGRRRGGRTYAEIRQAIVDAVMEYTAARREAEGNKDTTTLAQLEAPDVLLQFWQLERFDWKHLPWPGGLEDQPHILMYELDCVDEALKLQQRMEANQASQVAAVATTNALSAN